MSSIRLSRLGAATISLLLPVLLAAAGNQSAAAAQPVGACPDNYQLVTVKYVLKGAGLEEPDPSMDQNGDGYTCLLIVAGGKRASWHDNNL
jgi:hypothetical protein